MNILNRFWNILNLPVEKVAFLTRFKLFYTCHRIFIYSKTYYYENHLLHASYYSSLQLPAAK